MQKRSKKQSVGLALLLLIVVFIIGGSRVAAAASISKDLDAGTSGGITFMKVEDYGPGGGDVEPPSSGGEGNQNSGQKPTKPGIFPHTGETVNNFLLWVGILLIGGIGITIYWRKKRSIDHH